MGPYKFHGEIDYISPAQLEYVSSVLEEKGFKGPDVLFEAVGSAADNYIGNVKRVVVTENGETFKMIAKFASDNAMMREMSNLDMLFRNEHVIYSDILPKFKELQRSAGVPEGDMFRFSELYGSYTEVPHEVILLEDLKEDEYVLMDRFKPLTNDCVKMVLKNLAVYHSLSFVLKHREPDTFNAFKSKLFNTLTGPISKRPDLKIFFDQMEQGTLDVVQDEKYKRILKGSVSDLFSHALKVEKADTDSKHSVIQQGDGWTNNILFQIAGETPVRCAFVDYQLARESSPAFDIMYMLFNSTTHEQRQKHYYEYIDYYHDALDNYLYNYGLKASFAFPRDQLDAALKRYAKFILATSVIASSFLTKKTEDASKYKETMQNTDSEDREGTVKAALVQDQDTASLYKTKIEGLVDSFLEFGLLHII